MTDRSARARVLNGLDWSGLPVFEVGPFGSSANPIPAMGRFSHEAVAVDPKTGIVYETEDNSDGAPTNDAERLVGLTPLAKRSRSPSTTSTSPRRDWVRTRGPSRD